MPLQQKSAGPLYQCRPLPASPLQTKRPQVKHEIATKELANTQSALSKAEVKLIGFEEHFHEMVGEVDEKYQTRIHDLMVRNTDLRRIFVDKCEDLFELQNAIDFERLQKELGKDEEGATKIRVDPPYPSLP